MINNILFSLVFIVADVYILDYFFSQIYDKKQFYNKWYLTFIVVVSELILYASSYYAFMYFLLVFVEVFLIILGLKESRMLISKAVLFIVVKLIIELVFSLLFEWMFEMPFALLYSLGNMSMVKLLWNLVIKYLECVFLLYILKTKDKKVINIRYFKVFGIILSVFYGCCIMYNLLPIMFFKSMNKIIFFTLVIYNLLLIAFDRYYVKHEKIAIEYALKKQEFEYNQRIMIEQEEFRRMKHDMSNQIISLSGYVIQEKMDDAMGHIKKLIPHVTLTKSAIHIGEYAIDMLIDTKFEKAKRMGIEVIESYGIIGLGRVSIKDLVTMIGCALDNAIEAMKKIDENEKRVLTFNIKSNRSYLIISVGNSIKDGEDVDLEKTSKVEDSEDHGIGVREIKRLAKLYDGGAYYTISKDFLNLQILLLAVDK